MQNHKPNIEINNDPEGGNNGKLSNLNSYSLTAKLRKARRSTPLSATTQALFYELIAICNEDGWPNEFRCSNAELMNALRITEKTLIVARDSLISNNLISYCSGKSKREFSLYSFLTTGNTTANTTANTKSTVQLTGNTTANKGENPPDYYKQKQNETISINKGKNFPFKQSLIDYGFNKNLIDEWMILRRAQSNTERTFKIFISEIEKTNKDKNEVLEYILNKGWKRFEAEWLEKTQNPAKKNDSKLSFELRQDY